jgi:hypothetical protein
VTYAEKTNLWLAGKTIRKADVSGGGMVLEFEDGSVLDYFASDGGYSCWGLRTAAGDRVRFEEGGNDADK